MVESGFNLSINDGVGCILMILLLDYPYANFLIPFSFHSPHIIYRIAYLLYARYGFIRLVDCRSIEQRYCTL